eukprot:863567-Rhodomonas_salina.1
MVLSFTPVGGKDNNTGYPVRGKALCDGVLVALPVIPAILGQLVALAWGLALFLAVALWQNSCTNHAPVSTTIANTHLKLSWERCQRSLLIPRLRGGDSDDNDSSDDSDSTSSEFSHDPLRVDEDDMDSEVASGIECIRCALSGPNMVVWRRYRS